jgi:hypothetical protein
VQVLLLLLPLAAVPEHMTLHKQLHRWQLMVVVAGAG